MPWPTSTLQRWQVGLSFGFTQALLAENANSPKRVVDPLWNNPGIQDMNIMNPVSHCFFCCCSSSFECTYCSPDEKKQLISPAGDPYASRLEAAKTWFSREKRRNEWTKLYTLGQLAKVIVLPWVGQGGILTFKGGFTKGMRKSWKSHNCDEIAVARHWMYGVFTYIYPLQQCIPYIECLAYILSD